MQGLPTLQPVSTLTDLDGRGRAGASGLTPKRTPCRKRERGSFYLDTIHKTAAALLMYSLAFPQSHFFELILMSSL